MEHHDEAEGYDDAEAQRMLDEAMAMSAAACEGKTAYLFATLGSRTRMGGEVATATSEESIGGVTLARVGDTIRYPDGTESRIVSGAGFATTYGGQPAAIVGSAADNGDEIIDSRQSNLVLYADPDGDEIPGFLQPGYVPPPDVGG